MPDWLGTLISTVVGGIIAGGLSLRALHIQFQQDSLRRREEFDRQRELKRQDRLDEARMSDYEDRRAAVYATQEANEDAFRIACHYGGVFLHFRRNEALANLMPDRPSLEDEVIDLASKSNTAFGRLEMFAARLDDETLHVEIERLKELAQIMARDSKDDDDQERAKQNAGEPYQAINRRLREMLREKRPVAA